MRKELTEEEKRENTRKNLTKLVRDKGLKGKVYQDKIDEYMTFYDAFFTLNHAIKDINSGEIDENFWKPKDITNMMGELRRVSAEMRNVLSFLGLKPEPESGGGQPEKL